MRILLTVAVGVTAFAATPVTGQTIAASVKDGVYLEAQAERGRQLMTNVCSECHTEDEFTNGFMESWSGATVADLYDQLSSTMPEDNPGSLEPAEYAAALAYIFKLNGLPPGPRELASNLDTLQKILIEMQ